MKKRKIVFKEHDSEGNEWRIDPIDLVLKKDREGNYTRLVHMDDDQKADYHIELISDDEIQINLKIKQQ